MKSSFTGENRGKLGLFCIKRWICRDSSTLVEEVFIPFLSKTEDFLYFLAVISIFNHGFHGLTRIFTEIAGIVFLAGSNLKASFVLESSLRPLVRLKLTYPKFQLICCNVLCITELIFHILDLRLWHSGTNLTWLSGLNCACWRDTLDFYPTGCIIP